MNAAAAWQCSACGHRAGKSWDACSECGTWNSAIRSIGLAESAPEGAGRRVLLADAEARPVERLEVDEPWRTALGGGLAKGSSVLVWGAPKAGKTTAALGLAASVPGALFVPCEPNQTPATLRVIADREGLDCSRLYIGKDCTGLEVVCETIACPPVPPLVVVDSLSMLGDEQSWAALRQAAGRAALVCIMHVTKDGRMAGRNRLRHLVDTIVRVTKRTLVVRENRYAASASAVSVRR